MSGPRRGRLGRQPPFSDPRKGLPARWWGSERPCRPRKIARGFSCSKRVCVEVVSPKPSSPPRAITLIVEQRRQLPLVLGHHRHRVTEMWIVSACSAIRSRSDLDLARLADTAHAVRQGLRTVSHAVSRDARRIDTVQLGHLDQPAAAFGPGRRQPPRSDGAMDSRLALARGLSGLSECVSMRSPETLHARRLAIGGKRPLSRGERDPCREPGGTAQRAGYITTSPERRISRFSTWC